MSTKSHFILELGIEGFTDCSEPNYIFGNFVGDNAYLILSSVVVRRFFFEGQYLTIELVKNDYLPNKFKIWGDAIIKAEYDYDFDLVITLKGGHHITKKIVALDFTDLIIK